MATPAEVIELAAHMEWADAVVWASVMRSGAAARDDRIRIWLYHVHTVQRAFVQIWRNEEPVFREPSDFPDLSSLGRWGRDGHRQLQAFAAAATADTLAREIRLPWAAEIAETGDELVAHPTLAQTAVQLAMHSAHHRGQVNARLRELGGEPATADFIAWIWKGQPRAAWTFLD